MTIPLRNPILLVDDDPIGAELTLAAIGEVDPSVGVDIVGDGEEALDFLLRRGRHAARPAALPGAVLLDLKMPKLDGHEVLRRIRSESALRSLRVVILTSSNQPSDRDLSRELGSDDYLVKPNSILTLIEDLSRCTILRQPPLEPASGRQVP